MTRLQLKDYDFSSFSQAKVREIRETHALFESVSFPCTRTGWTCLQIEGTPAFGRANRLYYVYTMSDACDDARAIEVYDRAAGSYLFGLVMLPSLSFPYHIHDEHAFTRESVYDETLPIELPLPPRATMRTR